MRSMKKLSSIFKKLFSCTTILLLGFHSAEAQQDIIISKYENQAEVTSNNSITFKDGFVIPAGTDFKAYINSASSAGVPVNTQLNFFMHAIVSYSMRVPGIVDPSDPKNGVNQVNVEVQTIDHLGRVAETQSVKASPDFKDIIQLSLYDDAGRESKRWKPYLRNPDKNFLYEGEPYKVYDYYYTGLTKTPSIATDQYPYAETIFDNSPNNRVIEKGAPGQGFQAREGHSIRLALLRGTNDVAKYTVTINSTTGARKLVRATGDVYPVSELTINSIKDENVTDVGGTVYEYKDREGQVILKRVFKQAGSTIEAFSTYYVYDDLGNLSFVLPPLANPDNGTFTPAILDNLCYQYRYDDQKRMIGKKVPGKGWEFMVYNKLNQVVMSQDSVQRKKAPQEWNIIKYDGLGRNVITGIYVHTGSTSGTNYLATMQNNVRLQGAQWEERITTGNGYTNITFPKTWGTTLTINYYDNYNFPGGNPYPYAGVSDMTRGLLTGSKVNVLGSANMLWIVNYYDKEGRIVKNFKQHYKGGALVATNYDETTNAYDFTGALLSSDRSHKVSGTEQLKSLTEYDYDHRGRKINTWSTINTDAKVLLSKLVYDDLGQLWKKNLHSKNNGSTFLQTISYGYNERGWLQSASAPKLDIKIRYQNPTKGAAAQYNGNISEFEYTGEKSGNRWFKYTYDNLNRLTNSVYSTASELDETIAYDKAGNITSLKRGAAASTPISYSYANAGLSNQLSGVTGGRVGTFTYDGNGSAISDGTRSITSIVYNQLNLPATITVTGSQGASYLYDASGNKLKSIQGTTTREYVSGIHYKNNVLDFIGTEEGRAVRNTDGIYRYEYNLNDHLGNTRVSIDDNAGVARVIQENEYYAFGLDREKHLSGDKNNYLYNGKEEQETLTDEYDYGARFYDPQIGRFNTIDILSEMNRRFSTYSYGLNNPTRFIDVDGMYPSPPDLEVEKQKNGTYKVTGGTSNDDRNIYVMENGKRTGEVLGKMLTEYSFHDDDGNAVKGAFLNPGDRSGINFMNKEIVGQDPSLISYMPNATGGEKYDFKTRGMSDLPKGMSKSQFSYRGMPFEQVSGFGNQDGATITFASARDFGNVGAGYVAGKNGLSWGMARLGFDALESGQQGGFAAEGQPTQRAEKIGYGVGARLFNAKQTERKWNRAIWPSGPKY